MSHSLLIVDDEEWVPFVMEQYFETRGFQIAFAEDLEKAQAMLLHRSYSAVVSDLRLTGAHGAEGLELITFLRANRPEVRSILLTAYGSPSVKEEALRRGADAVLEKPLSMRELERAIDVLLTETAP